MSDDLDELERDVEESLATYDRLRGRGVSDELIQRAEQDVMAAKQAFREEQERAQEDQIYRKGLVDRVQAEVGDLVFHDEFMNPDVDVEHERQTAEHDIISGDRMNQEIEHVVQVMGRRPPDITITGWISEEQLEIADQLVTKDYVEVVTDRWTGVAVPIDVDTPYERTFHEKHGRIWEVTINLLGVRRGLSASGNN